MSGSLAIRKAAVSRCARLTVVILVTGTLGVMIGCATGPQFVRGSVTAIDPACIQLKHKTGQLVSIGLQQTTTYLWDDAPASLADVIIGTRVIVFLEQPGSAPTAQEVRILTRPRQMQPTPGPQTRLDRLD